jgi:hypothetical protein
VSLCLTNAWANLSMRRADVFTRLVHQDADGALMILLLRALRVALRTPHLRVG